MSAVAARRRRQRDLVLDAYLSGCRTISDVFEKTGLHKARCETLTAELLEDGFLIQSPDEPAGVPSRRYEPWPELARALAEES
jgi:DNA-binding IclR family transcriptional regulator